MSYNRDSDPNNRNTPDIEKVGKVMTVISFVFLLPFFFVGFGMLIRGIHGMSSGSPAGPFTLIFGIVWTVTLIFMALAMAFGFKRRANMNSRRDINRSPVYTDPRLRTQDNPNPSPAPASDPRFDSAEYIDPRNDPRFDYDWMKHDDCEADHSDDDDSVMKGYE